MADAPRKQRAEPAPMPETPGAPDDYEALAEAGEEGGGLFGRVNRRINEAIHTGRQGQHGADARRETRDQPHATADGLALARARSTNLKRMIIPDGVIIEGSLSSGSETEIDGRIDGNVTVEGNISLGETSIVSGDVRAANCVAQGLVEGRVDCAQEFFLGEKARLNADCTAGNQMIIQGQVFGNASCNGVLRMTPSAQVTGNIRARTLIIEEGATLNGHCAMRAPAQRSEEKR